MKSEKPPASEGSRVNVPARLAPGATYFFLFRSRPSPKIGVRHKKEANAFHFSRLSVELVEGFVVIFHCAAVGRTLARCHRSGTIQC